MHIAEGQAIFTRAIIQAGLDVAFFESGAAPPLLSPRQFRSVELPALRRILELTSRVLGTGYVVCNVETNQQKFVDRLCRTHAHVNVRINMDPDPGIVACPDRGRITEEVEWIVAIAAGRANCLMGTGCLPLETPPENIRFIRELLA